MSVCWKNATSLKIKLGEREEEEGGKYVNPNNNSKVSLHTNFQPVRKAFKQARTASVVISIDCALSEEIKMWKRLP